MVQLLHLSTYQYHFLWWQLRFKNCPNSLKLAIFADSSFREAVVSGDPNRMARTMNRLIILPTKFLMNIESGTDIVTIHPEIDETDLLCVEIWIAHRNTSRPTAKPAQTAVEFFLKIKESVFNQYAGEHEGDLGLFDVSQVFCQFEMQPKEYKQTPYNLPGMFSHQLSETTRMVQAEFPMPLPLMPSPIDVTEMRTFFKNYATFPYRYSQIATMPLIRLVIYLLAN